MRRALPLMLFALLAGCGADGAPERPGPAPAVPESTIAVTGGF